MNLIFPQTVACLIINLRWRREGLQDTPNHGILHENQRCMTSVWNMPDVLSVPHLRQHTGGVSVGTNLTASPSHCPLHSQNPRFRRPIHFDQTQPCDASHETAFSFLLIARQIFPQGKTSASDLLFWMCQWRWGRDRGLYSIRLQNTSCVRIKASVRIGSAGRCPDAGHGLAEFRRFVPIPVGLIAMILI